MASILPPATPLQTLGPSDDDEILRALQGYKIEAEQARRSGMNPRDQKWEQNLNLYWNRYDFSRKAAWQAREVMPEVPSYVDRFAAAMKEALVGTPDGFFEVSDPYDQENDLGDAIKRMMSVWLSTIGRNQMGTPLSFPAVFEEQMKLGALTAAAGVVTWKEDVKGGRVSFETVDPRFIWLDPTYRNLYRIRRTELDKHDLLYMAKATTVSGKSVFDLDKIDQLITQINYDELRIKMQMSGIGAQITSSRQPIVMDEYIATVIGPGGKVLADNALIVVANDKFIIRGPEKNPFWHEKDWMVYAPLVTTPLSPYGRSYMEDFGSIANTFTELTNLILDAVHMSAMKAYVIVPSMLANPQQAAEGVTPGKTFLLEDGAKASDFADSLDLGTLDAGAIQVWQSMKSELSEAAGINEVGLGQFAPKGRTSAMEISTTQANSSALVRSVAQTVETRLLDPLLDLVWKTGLQHASKTDVKLAMAAGTQLYGALMNRRREIISSPITFQARGISALISKSQMLQSVLQIMGIIAQNQNLTAAFMQQVDMTQLIKLLFRLSNVDLTKLQTSERDKLIQSITAPLQAAGAGGTPSPEGQAQMGSVAASMGVGQGQAPQGAPA